MTLVERINELSPSVVPFIQNPKTIEEHEIEEQLDILAGMQLYFELVQAEVRSRHSEHSSEFMVAHADAGYWKNKLMNAKVRARIQISNKERAL